MGNKIIMIVIIALLVVLIGLVGFVAVYGLQALQNNQQEPGYQQTLRPEKALSQREIDLVTFSDPIISPLKIGADGQPHVVSLKLSIGIDNTDKESSSMVSFLQEREPVVRDVIGQILRVTTYEELIELNDFNGIDILKTHILDALRVEFATNLIVNITLDVLYQ